MTVKNKVYLLLLTALTLCLTACGFYPRGEMRLAPALHKLYLQAADPYGRLPRSLKSYLKASKVQLTEKQDEATATLNIISDTDSQALLSVSGTQQTRQYNLSVTVVFDIEDAKGLVIVPPQTLTETRTITIQPSQILGSSNEANLYYQQMRNVLAYAIMNRIASQEITTKINDATTTSVKHR